MSKLRKAHITQIDNGNWKVYSEDKEFLGEFYRNLHEKQIIGIMEFAMRFEKEAYITGLEHGKDIMREAAQMRVDQIEKESEMLRTQLKDLTEHDALLARKLQQYIESGDHLNGNN